LYLLALNKIVSWPAYYCKYKRLTHLGYSQPLVPSTVVALGLGGPVQNIWGALSYVNLPVPSMRKCCDSDMFRAHQYTN